MVYQCEAQFRPRERRDWRRRAGRARRIRRALLAAAAVVVAALTGHAIWRGMAGGQAPGHHPGVTLIRQNPELPNGCEVTSMAMALGAAGCPVDKLTLYGCLPREPILEGAGGRFGPDPEQAYAGDAADKTGGWYCFEGPVVEAANRWLEAQGSPLRAEAVTGLSRVELEGYAGDGTPLVCWVTLNYGQPQRSESYTWLLQDGTVYRPYRNLHCVVLVGMEDEQYRVADPLSGDTQVEADRFWDSFSVMGRRAAAVRQG